MSRSQLIMQGESTVLNMVCENSSTKYMAAGHTETTTNNTEARVIQRTITQTSQWF